MQLNATKREVFGKKLNKVRQEFKLPAVIFGKGLESLPITLDYNDFVRVFEAAGETNIIEINTGDSKHNVLVKNYQVHPVNSRLLHVDFHEVNLKEKIQASVPIEITGEEENDLVDSGEGLVLVLLNEITVEALPTDLPDSFVVDVSGITEIDTGVTIAELNYNKEKVEIVGNEPDELVVKIGYAVQEEEEEELTEEEALAQIEATEETASDEDSDDSN